MIKYISLFFLSIIALSSCTKKSTLVEVTATVTFSKLIDSLPCQLYVEYFDITSGAYNQTISTNWSIQRSLHADQYATLKATSISNIKNFSIELSGVGATVNKNGNGNNTSIDIRKNMYE